jgi:hypothetical protein
MGKENSAPDLCWFLPYEHGLILVKPQQTTQIIMDPLGIQSSLANLDTLQRTGGALYPPRTWQNSKMMQNASALPATSPYMVAYLWPYCWVVLSILLKISSLIIIKFT